MIKDDTLDGVRDEIDELRAQIQELTARCERAETIAEEKAKQLEGTVATLNAAIISNKEYSEDNFAYANNSIGESENGRRNDEEVPDGEELLDVIIPFDVDIDAKETTAKCYVPSSAVIVPEEGATVYVDGADEGWVTINLSVDTRFYLVVVKPENLTCYYAYVKGESELESFVDEEKEEKAEIKLKQLYLEFNDTDQDYIQHLKGAVTIASIDGEKTAKTWEPEFDEENKITGFNICLLRLGRKEVGVSVASICEETSGEACLKVTINDDGNVASVDVVNGYENQSYDTTYIRLYNYADGEIVVDYRDGIPHIQMYE